MVFTLPAVDARLCSDI